MDFNFDNGTAIERLIAESEKSFSLDTFDDHLTEAQRAISGKGEFDANVERYGGKWLNGFLAFVYAFGLVYLSKWKLCQKLLHAWSTRQINEPKPGANVWLPILALLSGRFDPAGKQVEFGPKDQKTTQTLFLRNYSILKYAGSLAYMQAQGVSAAGAYQYLADHTPNGLLKAYRDGLEPSKKRKTYSDDDVKAAKKIQPLGAIPMPAKPVEAGETDFVEAVCVWDKDTGQLRIVSFLPESGSRARGRAIAKAKEPAPTDAKAQAFHLVHGVSI